MECQKDSFSHGTTFLTINTCFKNIYIYSDWLFIWKLFATM